MPSVLDTPETVHQEAWPQAEPQLVPAASAATSVHFRSSVIARLITLATRALCQPPIYWWKEEAPRPPEGPMERLARESPKLFLLGNSF